MSKLDKIRTAHKERQKHEWCADSMPHKSTKKAKAKERQLAKKLIKEEVE